MPTDLRAEIFGDGDLIRAVSAAPVWDLRTHGKPLYDALTGSEPAFAGVYELFASATPVQRRWAFGNHGAFSRPDRHVLRGGRRVRLDDDQREPEAVAEIEQEQPAVVAAREHPSAEGDARPGVGRAQFAAGVGSQHVVP